MMDRILACITPQTNSRRLIDRAAEEAAASKGELHILNVHKGDNIFFHEDSAELLDELFSYGTKKGGFIHALAGDDVPKMITGFAKKQGITKMVVGEPPPGVPVSSVLDRLSKSFRGVEIEIIVLEREK